MTNNKKQQTMNCQKRTQTKPILSRAQSRDLIPLWSASTADKIALPVRRSFIEDGSEAYGERSRTVEGPNQFLAKCNWLKTEQLL
jgi:hypothetical protein